MKIESLGNKILLMILPAYLSVIKNGGMLICDEFSSGLHNDLEELLVRYFMKHAHGAQIFIVSHSTNLLTSSLFRPDQLYAVNFDAEGRTLCASLPNSREPGRTTKRCIWVVCSVDCRNTMKFELQKGKRIGQVLFIVEGEKTEPNLIYKVFSGIFGYQMDRLYRNGTYWVFHRTDDPHSKITVINTEESNIQFIDKDNEFLNRMFTTLIEDYRLDIDNAAIYYLFDRDPASNTDETFIRNMLSSLASARDINADMTRQGMLLLSYPCIESFVGMNLLENSIQYCRAKGVQSGSDLKRALNEDVLLANNINEHTILHCTDELFRSLEMIGVNTENEVFMNSLDHFAENNSAIYEWQEAKRKESQQYGLLSLMAVALLDLGLIKISE